VEFSDHEGSDALPYPSVYAFDPKRLR
jgi:hypothetical protein